ncbi:MAG: hypothetical protein KZQ74_13400, partial [gamma proteobacterium symbiont of Bathyaustriella thionipta]|nr:hypothetical protein [gamma proteobacterium symbiont of Bathyaustriella thionipta]
MNLLLSNLQSLMGLTGISLLLSATIFRVLLFFKVKKSFAAIIAIILFALSYLSISGYSINFYVRGLFNDLSISSLVLLSYYLISSVNKTLSHNNPAYPAFSLIALTGLFFYPAALGLG